MYSSEITTSLISRIGFGTPVEIGFTIDVDEANSVGTSQRVFKSFHALATLENILATIDNVSITAADFNTILNDFRANTVREIMPLILDKHVDYDASIDYDQIITDNIVLFDDAIGYKVVIMVLESFVSTKRINISERNSKLAMSNLKLELNGYRNDAGTLVARGLTHELSKAIKDASKKIFPYKVLVKDGSNNW
jgi:hypothetical protein